MKKTKRLSALFLAIALGITMLFAPAEVKADTQTADDSVTVTLKVEEMDFTLISTQVTLTKEDVKNINSTFVVESGSVEVPVLTSEDFTAAHALGKQIMDTSSTPAKDLAFSYGSPAYIKGEVTCDHFVYWSYRVNHAAPSDESTGYGYTPDTCPIKDGDCIVFFRQTCYDPDAGDWGAYTKYSWFGQNSYETSVNTPVTVTYSLDDGFGGSTGPAANEEISIYENSDLVRKVTTDENGKAELSFEKAGTYTVTGGKSKNAVSEISHASATITVSGQTVVPTGTPTVPPAATPAPIQSAPPTAAPTATASVQPTAPSAAPTATASVQPTAPSAAPTATASVQTTAPVTQSTAAPVLQPGKTHEKPAVPKKLTASVKKKSSASSKKVTLRWKKAAGADGYQISVSKKNKKNFKKLARTTKNTLTKKFKKGTFYIKIRSYAKQNGKTVYSKYSSIIKVKIQ